MWKRLGKGLNKFYRYSNLGIPYRVPMIDAHKKNHPAIISQIIFIINRALAFKIFNFYNGTLEKIKKNENFDFINKNYFFSKQETSLHLILLILKLVSSLHYLFF